ncbi:hypothetical protein ACIQRE_27570 [Streptomyces griseoluteus]|uniref:hypothetical protein n=1 Tax=Streptomyces griseoluteus TaxID=29306 RepID=UPI0037F3C723
MTISLGQPALGLVDRSMVEPYSVVDPRDEPHTDITVRVRVSRDQLAAAVEQGIQYYGTERHPSEWTDEEVRAFAAMNLIALDELELQQNAESMARIADGPHPCPVERGRVLAVYAAVDRVFLKAC